VVRFCVCGIYYILNNLKKKTVSLPVLTLRDFKCPHLLVLICRFLPLKQRFRWTKSPKPPTFLRKRFREPLIPLAIRFVVIDRYITQGTRSENGRLWSERIWTVLATCTSQSRNAFDFICQSIQAHFSDQPFPSSNFAESLILMVE
jgi:hypothetical protein